MKRILPEFEFSAEQLNIIKSLAAECNLCEDTVKILYGRGITGKREIYDFLHPSKEHFISPFKMRGVSEAVELIKRARDEDWCVVVYGDYDADGVCAATIMGNALKEFGITPVLCVPERRNGYGLSFEVIDVLFEEYFPQLVITVDCGISCAEEVKYIQSQGAEVIVTDHHELPATIPDCICINPKFNDGYAYDNLCGAGVAFKMAVALLGEKAYKYLDFAAIATVADSVPLTGENRDIVYEGLKIINSSPRSCYSGFYKQEGAVNSQTLSFSIAPKINAAGRMGDARAALELFNAENEREISDLSAKLASYNMERQKYCDELYVSAKETLAEEGVDGKIIILKGSGWNAGFIGIVAARLADEFSRPVILFVQHGDMLRGSARSVENVNIFEALKSCKELIDEFGGHSQAAGINVSAQNFEAFKKALNDYMCKNYTDGDFLPTVYVSGELEGPYSPRFAHELEMLEPFGVGNKRPVFLLRENGVPVRPVKAQSPHIFIKSDSLELVFFGGSRFMRLIESSAPKSVVFEYNVSKFKGKEYVKGFVRDIIYDSSAVGFAGEEAAINGILNLSLPAVKSGLAEISGEEVEEAMEKSGDFGTVFIADDYAQLKKFKNSARLKTEVFNLSAKNFSTCALVSPQSDVDFSGYSRIIYLGCGNLNIPSLAGRRVEVLKGAKCPKYILQLNPDRLVLLAVFSALCANVNNIKGANEEEVAKNNDLGCSAVQAVFALCVFKELGLISFDGGSLTIFRGVKTDLTKSPLYVTVQKMQAEAKI